MQQTRRILDQIPVIWRDGGDIVSNVCVSDRSVFGRKEAAPELRPSHYGETQQNQPEASHHQRQPALILATQHAARVIAMAGRHIPQIADAEVESVGVGWRPLPLDGLPVVGHVPDMPGIYLASMHSGVTLAPIIGHLAAMEILDNARVDLLSDFRVERFLA